MFFVVMTHSIPQAPRVEEMRNKEEKQKNIKKKNATQECVCMWRGMGVVVGEELKPVLFTWNLAQNSDVPLPHL